VTGTTTTSTRSGPAAPATAASSTEVAGPEPVAVPEEDVAEPVLDTNGAAPGHEAEAGHGAHVAEIPVRFSGTHVQTHVHAATPEPPGPAASTVSAEAGQAPASAPSVPISPAPAPVPAPAPAAPTGSAGSTVSTSGSGHHGLSGLPLAVLGSEIAGPPAQASDRAETAAAGRAINSAAEPGSRPD
jgi:hypothetical protein